MTMKTIWDIPTEEVAKVTSFVEKCQDDPFLKERVRKNLRTDPRHNKPRRGASSPGASSESRNC